MDGPTSTALQERVQALFEHVLLLTDDASQQGTRLLELRLRAFRLVDGPVEEARIPQSDVVIVN